MEGNQRELEELSPCNSPAAVDLTPLAMAKVLALSIWKQANERSKKNM